MRKIAIITTRDLYFNYDDDRHVIVDSITDWTEVSEEDYTLLNKAANYRGGFAVIEQPTAPKEFIKKTIEDYIKFEKAEQEKRDKEKKAREEAALQRKIKKELKDKKSKLALFNKLKEELGDETAS